MKMNIIRKIEAPIESLHADDIFSMLLKDRGINNAESFVHPTDPMEISFGSFFNNSSQFKKDWKRTIELLRKIKDSKKMIVVYMDYDADGITGGAVLWQTLHALGFKTMPHIPNRKKEGYGFSKVGIDMVKERYDPALIISVDHGIVAHEQIEYASSLGIDVIVTDHHQKKETNPEKAFAIFHTDKVSGSGVAYFFAKELLESFPDENLKKRFSTDFVALAAIGIIADLVPLVAEARSVAQYGLRVLSKPILFAKQSPGLSSLLQESGILGRSISTYDVGYVIAPRINAFGRIKDATDALRLLCTNDTPRAKKLAAEAGITNKERQDLVEQAIEEARRTVDVKNKILIAYGSEWEEGIVGLIAGKLTQEHHKPAIVLTRSDGHAKASARSISSIDITAFLRDLDEYFIDLGGHAAAAGFSMQLDKIEAFILAAHKKADTEITESMLQKIVQVDMELPVEALSNEFAHKLELLEPYGIGNKTPVFLSEALVRDINYMGSTKQHVKILFKAGSSFIEAIYFNGADQVKKELNVRAGDKKNTARFLCNLYIDRWNGKEKLSLRIGEIILP